MKFITFDKIFKLLLVLIGVAFLYLIYLIYGIIKENGSNGRYQKFGESKNRIIDTRTGCKLPQKLANLN